MPKLGNELPAARTWSTTSRARAAKRNEASASARRNWRISSQVRIPPYLLLAPAILPGGIQGGEASPTAGIVDERRYLGVYDAGDSNRVLFLWPACAPGAILAIEACYTDGWRIVSSRFSEHFETEHLVRTLGAERVLAGGQLFIYFEFVDVIRAEARDFDADRHGASF